MKTILFDMLSANGHLNPSFHIAESLINDGYNVVYLTNINKKKYIEKAGFKTEIVTGNILHKGLVTSERSILALLKAIVKDRIYHFKRKYFFLKLEEYKTLLDRISPSLIILDAHCFSRVLIYEQGNFPIIKLTTTIPNQKRKCIPPMTIYHLPTFDFKGYVFSELCWKYSEIKYFIKSLFLKIALLNQDSTTNWLYYAKKLNFPKDQIHGIWKQKLLDLAITGYKEVFMYPYLYDFKGLNDENSFFYKITLKNTPTDPINNDEYKKLLDLIKSNRYGKIIYCSLGTVGHLFEDKYNKFFKKLKIIASLNPSFLFIFSTGGNKLSVSSDISNLLVYQYLPQIDLLNHVDMMISHGGMNGIIECILTQTPILVIRVYKKTDNQGCAARIVYHKLGLSAKASDSPKKLNQKIAEIIAEKEIIRDRMKSIDMYNQDNSGYRLIKSVL